MDRGAEAGPSRALGLTVNAMIEALEAGDDEVHGN